MKTFKQVFAFLGSFAFLSILVCLIAFTACKKEKTFLNVSYDPTRELYKEYNEVFAKYWENKTGEKVDFQQSNGGSGSQARKVIGGLDADVVTLALAFDIDNIAKPSSNLINPEWQKRLPNNSCPYTSTIVFLVRKGNPKGIKDWDDLLKEDVQIITPDPRSSGGARWNYLAAWGYALKKELGDLSVLNDPSKKAEVDAAQEKAFEFVKGIFNADKVPVMDSGARQSTNTFVQNKRGDVLLAWENEALYFLSTSEGKDLEVVVPSISILAEPPVTIVDGTVDAKDAKDKSGEKNARKLAEAYLEYLYSPEGQEICAKHYYRPSDPEVAKKYADKFPHVELFKIDDVFGGWHKAQEEHFYETGTFEKIGKKK
ncbi:MAG: sulfate ABC transporter substrate-binding protein [Thermoguttaceae bacterium]